MNETSGLYLVLADYNQEFEDIDRKYLHAYSETITRKWEKNDDGIISYLESSVIKQLKKCDEDDFDREIEVEDSMYCIDKGKGQVF